jgi:uncharacterized protein YecE (DUF72 family)
VARIVIGISGWSYKHWRGGPFYPAGLRQRDELRYVADQLDSVELNGTFYSLQRPDSFRAWHAQTPDTFVFAVKGSRFISHNKKLRGVDTALANFFASGLLLLGEKLGPIVWQLPERMRFDPERLDSFLSALPRDTTAAAELAKHHDARVDGRDWTETDARRPLRYALEPRNTEFFSDECVDILRRHDVAFVAADSGRWPLAEEVTASFVYLRLHGSPVTYASRYSDAALDRWAAAIDAWARGSQPDDAARITDRALPSRRRRDVYCYFDNDGNAHAPQDALRLRERLARLEGSELIVEPRGQRRGTEAHHAHHSGRDWSGGVGGRRRPAVA